MIYLLESTEDKVPHYARLSLTVCAKRVFLDGLTKRDEWEYEARRHWELTTDIYEATAFENYAQAADAKHLFRIQSYIAPKEATELQQKIIRERLLEMTHPRIL